MKTEQREKMANGRGFIAALDQSGGSTPKALRLYGVPEDAYSGDDEMFDLIHQMRTRIITSPAFTGARILGAILFEQTMDRDIEGRGSADFLWSVKNVVPFLKVDKGLEAEADGVQVMKPIDGIEATLERAKAKGVFGTKMRSVIKEGIPVGVAEVVDQQFEVARTILAAGLVPIVEPEVDIHSPTKEQAEVLLRQQITDWVDALPATDHVMLKLTLPTQPDFYADLIAHPRVLRVVALSGGYSRAEADALLQQNHGMIASFSRALTEGLSVDQSDEQFTATLDQSIQSIYDASLT